MRIQIGGAQNAIFEYNADEKGIFKLGPASGIGITFNGASGNANFAGITTSITSSVIGSHTSPLTIGAVSSHHLTVANDNASMILGKSNNDALYLRRNFVAGRYVFQTYSGGNDGLLGLQPFGGKVGIASAIPTSTLDVNGDVSVGSGITLSPDGNVFTTGVTTSTTFVGNLTGDVTGDADTVDSLHASSFIRSDADDSFDGTLTAASDATNPVLKIKGAGPNFIQFTSDAGGTVDDDSINFVYRTTPNTLGYERASDDTVLFSVDADNAQANFGGDVSIVDKIVHTGDTNTAIRFPAADTITAETDGSERLRITSDGKIGIGADNPTQKVQINNGVDDPNIVLLYGADTSTEYAGIGVFQGNATFTGGGIGSNNTGISLRTASGGTETERLRIEAAGNVKIEKNLNVVGVVTASSFTATSFSGSGASITTLNASELD